jgi:hypothetical protein
MQRIRESIGTHRDVIQALAAYRRSLVAAASASHGCQPVNEGVK